MLQETFILLQHLFYFNAGLCTSAIKLLQEKYMGMAYVNF